MTYPRNLMLGEGERIIYVARAHWLTELIPLLFITLFFLIPFFLLWPLFTFGIIGVVIFFMLIMLAIFSAYREYRRWWLSALILTSKRLFWVQQKGLVDHVVMESFYNNIQDISYQIKGLWSTIGHFGTLRLQMAGAARPLEIRYLSKPNELQRIIQEMKEKKTAKSADADGDWWEDRILQMSKDEWRDFFNKIRRQIGDERWRDLFRTGTKNDDQKL